MGVYVCCCKLFFFKKNLCFKTFSCCKHGESSVLPAPCPAPVSPTHCDEKTSAPVSRTYCDEKTSAPVSRTQHVQPTSATHHDDKAISRAETDDIPVTDIKVISRAETDDIPVT